MLKYAYRLRFILKNVIYCLQFLGRITWNPIRVCLEEHTMLTLTGTARITFSGKFYCKRFSNLECHNGTLRIGNDVFMNKNFTLVCRSHIEIGNDCMFGNNVSIYDHDHDTRTIPFARDAYVARPIRIGDNVWVGCNVFIGKGVVIGDNVVIAANAVVTSNIESNTLYFSRTHRKPLILEQY